MKTYIGKVGCWYYESTNHDIFQPEYNGELELIDYSLKLYLTRDSGEIIYLDENAEYAVDSDSDSWVTITNVTTNEMVVRLTNFTDNRPGRRITYPFDATNVFYKVKDHIQRLNEKYYHEMKKSGDSFQTKMMKRVAEYKSDNVIRKMTYNFIGLHSPIFLYINRSNLDLFKSLILGNLGRGESLSLLHGDQSYKITDMKDELLREKLENYYDNFLKLADVLTKRESFKSNDEAIFFTWILFNEEVCHFYYDQFNELYGDYFPNIDNASLADCIDIYFNLNTLDREADVNICRFTFYLMYLNKFPNHNDYFTCFTTIKDEIEVKLENKEKEDFEAMLLKEPTSNKVTIEDVDLMGGHEFEFFIEKLFRKMGYHANVTKGSGDQGVDIVAEKNGRKYGIQTKCYSSMVSNTSIQEVVAGLRYYDLDKGIVVTNNYFTNSAKELAESNNVILWDRDVLQEKMLEFIK